MVKNVILILTILLVSFLGILYSYKFENSSLSPKQVVVTCPSFMGSCGPGIFLSYGSGADYDKAKAEKEALKKCEQNRIRYIQEVGQCLEDMIPKIQQCFLTLSANNKPCWAKYDLAEAPPNDVETSCKIDTCEQYVSETGDLLKDIVNDLIFGSDVGPWICSAKSSMRYHYRLSCEELPGPI